MNDLSCDIKKLLKKLETLDDYAVERLVIENLQRNLNTLDELQQSYQRHYLTIIRTLLQQLASLPGPRQDAVQKQVACLEKLLTHLPTLSDLETLEQGLSELQNLLRPLPVLASPGQIIGDLPTGPHLPSAEAITPTQAALNRVKTLKQNNTHFAGAVEEILKTIEKLKSNADLVQHELHKQALQLLQGQRQLAEQLAQLQQQLVSLQAQNQRLSQELQHARTLSLTDELTGLPNRRGLLRRIEEEVGRITRHPSPLTLAILDIDHFKQVNDEYGHTVGDQVLKAYADHLQAVFRRHDCIARFGGEEFVLLLPSTNVDGALKALAKIRERTTGHVVQTQSKVVPLPTFSAGVASYRLQESIADFLHRADQALYRAKQNGRNRIETAD